ncbi:interleukin-1 receptor-associated kinase 4-like [Anticarsia gemmatalis]|uniref:interleukin-1 receptor-associated kinase 4-like n=1 Tax=Anticarsia gemmatalis TaxID=129554 RepID=UPI003F767E67
MVSRRSELRKVPGSYLRDIAGILEINNDYNKLLPHIPKHLDSEEFEPKYTYKEKEDMREHAERTAQYFAEVLFQEWGSSGKVRPTLGDLIDILQKAKLFDAASSVARILGEPPPPRQSPSEEISWFDNQSSSNSSSILSFGSQRETTGIGSSEQHEEYNVPDLTEIEEVDTSARNNINVVTQPSISSGPEASNGHHSNATSIRDILKDKNLIKFTYKDLKKLTLNFIEEKVITDKGTIGNIGAGGYGDVYGGISDLHGPIAVKRLRDVNRVKQFASEVKSLSYLRHINIVPIIGYSIDGPAPCIVCKYIDGGSLQAKIAAKVLTEQQRIKIMAGTAEGLKYIHYKEKPLSQSSAASKSYYLHGDVKSANILVTRECVPMLCDFGLAKQLDTTKNTIHMGGTVPYLAPEANSGTLTRKLDIFSFGTVLLELLTGLPVRVHTEGERINIRDYVKSTCPDGDITKLLDPSVQQWTIALEVYELAKCCINEERNSRPAIDYVWNVLKDLENVQSIRSMNLADSAKEDSLTKPV